MVLFGNMLTWRVLITGGGNEADLDEFNGLNWKLFDGAVLMHMDEADMFYELFAEISLGGF